ncbi:hypothetical protein Syun_031007 [Stephania yunnanensis]|uniref:Uncharacterized protein n=1 Tax=Stephania yunnanensis TaxID=152371 RepID=A0AAP0DYW9_9MAGN
MVISLFQKSISLVPPASLSLISLNSPLFLSDRFVSLAHNFSRLLIDWAESMKARNTDLAAISSSTPFDPDLVDRAGVFLDFWGRKRHQFNPLRRKKKGEAMTK